MKYLTTLLLATTLTACAPGSKFLPAQPQNLSSGQASGDPNIKHPSQGPAINWPFTASVNAPAALLTEILKASIIEQPLLNVVEQQINPQQTTYTLSAPNGANVRCTHDVGGSSLSTTVGATVLTASCAFSQATFAFSDDPQQLGPRLYKALEFAVQQGTSGVVQAGELLTMADNETWLTCSRRLFKNSKGSFAFHYTCDVGVF